MRTLKTKMITVFICLFVSCSAFAQQPPPPPGGGHGSGNNQAPGGGGAPIEGSPFLLPLLAAGYGAIRWLRNRDNNINEPVN